MNQKTGITYERNQIEAQLEEAQKKAFQTLGFDQILEQLAEEAASRQAKEQLLQLKPLLSEGKLLAAMRDTTQARRLLEEEGLAPIPMMEHMGEILDTAEMGGLLMPEELEEFAGFLAAVKRLKSYLERGKEKQIGLAFYSENLTVHEELAAELARTIRNGRIDDYATKRLRDIRRDLQLLDEKIRQKAEAVLRANKSWVADSFVVQRNGRICIPVKKKYKGSIEGSVVDQSSTGATVFVEPRSVERLRTEYEMGKLEEDTEERCILYTLTAAIYEQREALLENMKVIIRLDTVFAKGKLSIRMDASEPEIVQERTILLREARHPLLEKASCVPLNFSLEKGKRGVVITGPNTGGKTVAIKTVGLLSLMACAGLHIPAKEARIAMNSQVLCDIGDGQNMQDNLSTFSAHMKNVLQILEAVHEESLVVLDELGSGTDPAEGMGIAVAILEELRKSGALFLVTTHYPEVKEYAELHEEIENARMAFDRESLRPLYRLEMGKSGESCALYIAKRLGIPNEMLRCAAKAAYGEKAELLTAELGLSEADGGIRKIPAPRLQKPVPVQKEAVHGMGFARGDSVAVQPEGKIGIVVKPADRHGNVLVQIQKEKQLINHKRLKLKVAADKLYPEDYDFSILFDTVEHRKVRHQMEKGHQEGMQIKIDSPV